MAQSCLCLSQSRVHGGQACCTASNFSSRRWRLAHWPSLNPGAPLWSLTNSLRDYYFQPSQERTWIQNTQSSVHPLRVFSSVIFTLKNESLLIPSLAQKIHVGSGMQPTAFLQVANYSGLQFTPRCCFPGQSQQVRNGCIEPRPSCPGCIHQLLELLPVALHPSPPLLWGIREAGPIQRRKTWASLPEHGEGVRCMLPQCCSCALTTTGESQRTLLMRGARGMLLFFVIFI